MSVFSSFHRAFVSVEFFPRASTSVYVFMWTRREIDKSRELYRKKNGKKCSSCEWMRVCVYTLCGCLFGCKVSSFDVASLSFPSQMQWEAILFFFFLFHIFINNPGFVCCISVCVCVRWTKKNATLDRPSFPQNLGEISNNDIDYLRIALSIGAELEIGRQQQPPFDRFLSVRCIYKWDFFYMWMVAEIYWWDKRLEMTPGRVNTGPTVNRKSSWEILSNQSPPIDPRGESSAERSTFPLANIL